MCEWLWDFIKVESKLSQMTFFLNWKTKINMYVEVNASKKVREKVLSFHWLISWNISNNCQLHEPTEKSFSKKDKSKAVQVAQQYIKG